MNVTDNEIGQLLSNYKKLTVYGLSPDAGKASHEVALFLRSRGYDLVGVNPRGESIASIPVFTTLADVPAEYRRFVNVFRRSEKIPDVVDEVLAAGGVEVLWLQLGITHSEAESRAEAAGLKVVSDRCMAIELKKR